jgi:hypothetical protein
MGIQELIVEVMRSKGAPMTTLQIYQAVIAQAAADSQLRRRYNEASNWFNIEYVGTFMQRRSVGVDVPHAESKKLFRVFDADKYFLADGSGKEEPTPVVSTPVAKDAPVRQPGPVFGAPLNFRGLRHAPINELGVVYIFGMVSYELGFIVEALQSSFPDCEAKRSIGKDRWQRTRIEFEFRSSNFRAHKHPLDGADLIVCWEHDWPDCPLEVIELRGAIISLKH